MYRFTHTNKLNFAHVICVFRSRFTLIYLLYPSIHYTAKKST